MSQEKHITGFFITFHGDKSVGIQNNEWAISGDFWLDDETLKGFKGCLIASFELVSDTPLSVETFEERGERIKKENENTNSEYIKDNT